MIEALLKKHLPGVEVWAYGSRVNGQSHDGSDLDLVLRGPGLARIDTSRLIDFTEALRDSTIPFLVEAHDWAGLPESFHREIERDHVVLTHSTASREPPANWIYHPLFPVHWDRRPLYSMAQWVNGLAYRDIEFSAAGRPIIKIAEIKGGISNQTKFTYQNFDESVRVRAGDLLFSWSGQPETSIDAFWWRGPEGWLNQHIFRVTPFAGIDTTFFFYLLRYLNPNFVAIARNKQTTGLGHVTKRDLENIESALPEYQEQCAIAHILGTLDEKIELNRRMNETLEAMARALFKSWFVDFDPVRAKMEGRDTGLPQPIADLFPDRFADSELGYLPEGWRRRTVSHFATIKGGKQLSKDKFVEDGPVPVFGGAGVMGHTNNYNADGYVISVGRVGAYCGQFSAYWGRTWINNNASHIAQNDDVPGEWLFLALRNLDIDLIKKGAAQPFVSNSDLAKMEIVSPDGSVRDVFSNLLKPWRRYSKHMERETKILTSLRDTLLPKLISGEIRLRDAVTQVESVA